MDEIKYGLEKLKTAISNVIEPYIKLHDYLTLLETAGILIHDLVDSDPMIYANSSFENFIITEITILLGDQLENFLTYDIIENIVKEALIIFYTYISPRRSYKNSFIRVKPNIIRMKNKIKYLKDIPQPEQRTDEWYQFRYKYLTASSIWKALGTQNAVNQLIYDKCKPLDVSKYQNVNVNSPMHWGQKYEPLSILWYENQYETEISDFGCLPHKSISFLAASPDGINTHSNNDRFGRMVEVKNIFNRVINGIPKMEYWIQMQVQMEVCNLNECDFLETRFIEYANEEEFFKDGTFKQNNQGKSKGIIMYFVKDGKPHYEYPPWNINHDEFNLWEKEMMTKHTNLLWIQNIYWYLDQVSCILVLRNKHWFAIAKDKLENVWKIIEKERITGYTHRAPNKKNKSLQKQQFMKTQKCYIDIGSLLTKNSNIENNAPKIINNDSKIIQINTQILQNTFDDYDLSLNIQVSK